MLEDLAEALNTFVVMPVQAVRARHLAVALATAHGLRR